MQFGMSKTTEGDMVMEQKLVIQSDFKDRAAKEPGMKRFMKTLNICSLIGLAGYVICTLFSMLTDAGLHKYGVYADRIAGVCWFLFSVAIYFKILFMILGGHKNGSRVKTIFKAVAWSGFAAFVLFSELSMISDGFFYRYHEYYEMATVVCLSFVLLSLICLGIVKFMELGKNPGR